MMKKAAEATGGAAADEKLFEMLKELRQKEAKKKTFLHLLFSWKHPCRIWLHCIPQPWQNWKNARV